MSTESGHDAEVAVIGAGVVGCAVALGLARRRVSVALVEAEDEVGLGASGTNSGILHTGFDSAPGQLETELILRAAALRAPVIETLEIPVVRCGAVMRAFDEPGRRAVASQAARARANGVVVIERSDGGLDIPGEAITDPAHFTLALASAAQRHDAQLRVRAPVAAIERGTHGLKLMVDGDEPVRCRAAVNCAGLYGDRVARMAGDDSFEIYPRKGEFLVFEQPGGARLEQILLPVPSKRTKGVLVFPTLDGKLVAGPTAVDIEDKDDWSVRPEARDEILAKATALYPALADAEPITAYAGLRPAGRGVNYVIGVSGACERLVNVAAIRSTGLTASLGIAEHVAGLVGSLGISLREARDPIPGPTAAFDRPWWRRVAAYRTAA